MKATVKRVVVIECDGCGEAVAGERDGVVVCGSVYAARVEATPQADESLALAPVGGLIGSPDRAGETAWHWACFLRALRWGRDDHAMVTEEEADEVLSDVFPVDRELLEGADDEADELVDGHR